MEKREEADLKVTAFHEPDLQGNGVVGYHVDARYAKMEKDKLRCVSENEPGGMRSGGLPCGCKAVKYSYGFTWISFRYLTYCINGMLSNSKELDRALEERAKFYENRK
ncbi:hypothetical protein DY000_02052178 [Brassica cretica]|uniref:Uncharacterized protein n=1 Tax=Brassica cretica TaxID=69181 RepID=A0ABQ7A8Z2_BRACR|nr:hypothetical protein DY000_02052178 [Brassica cretica]